MRDHLWLTGWEQAMATVTRVRLTCDLCGDAEDVKTRTFELDGKAYEIDLCRKDGKALGAVAAAYIAKARKITAGPGQRQRGGRPRVRQAAASSGNGTRAAGSKASDRARVTGSSREKAKTGRSKRQATAASGTKATGAGSKQKKEAGAEARRVRPRDTEGNSPQAAGGAGARQQKGIYVYGILPADIEVAADMPGVGEHPGLLRVLRVKGLAALISEVDLSARLGSPDDLSTYREILDATAVEVPVLPLPFGTVLATEDAVSEELLAARHDEFTAALDQLEGRAEFQVKCRYVDGAAMDGALSENKQAARLRKAIHGKDPEATRNARIELGQLVNEAVTARREQDTRALTQAMGGVSAASVTREPTHELDAAHVAFLVAVDDELEVERVVEALARDWEGRIDVQLLGPMAAYDFAGTALPES